MLVLNNVSLRRGVKLVLDQASVTLQPGEKIGLVGRNGAGKSSLFALLTGKLQADAGDVQMPPRWLQPGGMAEVAQDMPETDRRRHRLRAEGDTPLDAWRSSAWPPPKRPTTATRWPRRTTTSRTPAASTPAPARRRC